MNRKIITPILCVHLLITPQMHAWQMPKLDQKQIGIIAVVTAAVLSLLGFVWYKHAKRANQRVTQAPVVDRGGLEAVQPDSHDVRLNFVSEINKLREEVTGLKREIAVTGQQIGMALKTLSEDEQVFASINNRLDHHQKLIMAKSQVSGELARRMTTCEGEVRLVREHLKIKADEDERIKLNTRDKHALQKGIQELGIAKTKEDLAKQKQEKAAGAGQVALHEQHAVQKTLLADHVPTPAECGEVDKSTFIVLKKQASALPSVTEEDFARSLTPNGAEELQRVVSANGLQRLDHELDEPLSADKLKPKTNGATRKRSLSQ